MQILKLNYKQLDGLNKNKALLREYNIGHDDILHIGDTFDNNNRCLHHYDEEKS